MEERGTSWDAVEVLVPRRIRDRLAGGIAALRREIGAEVATLPGALGGGPADPGSLEAGKAWVSAVIAALPGRRSGGKERDDA